MAGVFAWLFSILLAASSAGRINRDSANAVAPTANPSKATILTELIQPNADKLHNGNSAPPPPLSCSGHKVFPAIAEFVLRLSAPAQNPNPIANAGITSKHRLPLLATDTTAPASTGRNTVHPSADRLYQAWQQQGIECDCHLKQCKQCQRLADTLCPPHPCQTAQSQSDHECSNSQHYAENAHPELHGQHARPQHFICKTGKSRQAVKNGHHPPP